MNIVSPFIKQCTQTPDKLALIETEQAISYANLQQSITKLADFLQQQHINNQCIAIAIDRGINATCCLYSILSAGGIYLPLDIKNPANRLNYIIQDAQPRYILGIGEAPVWLAPISKKYWLNIINLLTLQPSKYFKPVEVAKNSLAAILYTSGSTGNPKGVALSHQALFNFSHWAKNTFHINAQERIASLAPLHFDLSIFDLFSSLSAGASVYFIPNKLTYSPSRLSTWLSENAITTWYTVPSLLSFMALKGNLNNTPLPQLKQLLFAGEVFPSPHLITLCQLLPTVKLYNLYGPTETNVCTYWPVVYNRLNRKNNIPIGLPACNATLTISPETGELLVNSLNNFSGYWYQGRLHANDNKIYHTNDKVSLNKDNEYEYHGRLDRMLKCSGYRVEPAEIEYCINQLAGIIQCAVIGIKDSTSGQRPAAIVVLKDNAQLAETIKPLRTQLATYMQPFKFKVVAALPTLSNGKTDYQKIKSLFKHL